MASVVDTLLNAAAQQGLNVVVKTQYGPEMQVYNAAAPSAPPSPWLNWIGPVGIQLRDANGKVIYSNGHWPETNPGAIALLVGTLVGAGALAAWGLRKGL